MRPVKARVGVILGDMIARRQPARADPDLATWELAIGKDGTLWLGPHALVGLAERFGTPAHVVNARRLRARAVKALAPVGRGVGCDVFYSYKTNPVPGVLAMLHAAGIGAEVISEYELWLATRLGVPADRIIYNGPAKSASSLRKAVELGLLLINANSVGDLHAVVAAAQDVDRVASVGIRVALPSMWGGQFGLSSTSAEVDAMVEFARASDSVELVGFHVHRGHAIRTAADMTSHVAEVLEYLDRLRARTGWWPSILDLGGSLTTATVASIPRRQFRLNRALATDLLPPDPASSLSVGDASRLAFAIVAQHAQNAGLAVPRVVLEPGRGLTGDTQFLLCSVLDVKADQSITHLVLDAGINVAEPTRTEFHQLLSVSQPSAPTVGSFRLAGPICTPADVLYNHWRLPAVAAGHVLAIMDTGAYYVPFSTSFSFPRPAIVLVDGEEVVTLRRAESFEDMVRLDDLPMPNGAPDET